MDPTLRSDRMSARKARAGFWSTVGWTLVILAVFIGAALIGRWISKAAGDPPVLKIIATGIAPAAVGIIATLSVQAKLEGNWQSVGLRPASRFSLLVGLVAGLPLLIGYGIIFGVLGVKHTTVPYVGLVIVKFVIAQGMAEEVIFRGFVFGRLRTGRSFIRAATLSAVVFALAHLSNFLHGFSTQVVINVIMSTLLAFVIVYPAALLFERSGQTIWPFAITHVMIDSMNWFKDVWVPGPGLYVYLAAILLTAGWTVALALRFTTTPPAKNAETLTETSGTA